MVVPGCLPENPGVIPHGFLLMISIKQCREILTHTGDKLSDDQLKDILDHFYLLSSIIYQQEKKEKHEKKSNDLHPGLNG